MIGLFAMSQAFQGVEEIMNKTTVDSDVKNVIPTKSDFKLIGKLAPILVWLVRLLESYLEPVRRSQHLYLMHRLKYVKAS